MYIYLSIYKYLFMYLFAWADARRSRGTTLCLVRATPCIVIIAL